MKDEHLKKILSANLDKVSTETFNERILQRLNLSKKKQRLVLFDQKSMVIAFLLTSCFVLGSYLEPFKGPGKNYYLVVGLLAFISPLFLMVFNKIYSSTFQKNTVK